MGGGQPGGAGHPESGVDNYSTETAVDASANGQGTVANKFIVDGLNVTSGIRQGVLNLTPNPDAIQETSIQVNTFSSEYGGGSSIQMASTTKSGADRFHGVVSDYYNNQSMYAKTVFMGPDADYNPFHTNNFSAAIGGPIIPKKQLFFFFAVRAAPIVGFDRQSDHLLPGSAVRAVGAAELSEHVRHQDSEHLRAERRECERRLQNGGDIFPGTCGTAATNNLPCSLPMIDSGIFNSSNFRDGDQYFLRADKHFANDRIYGSFFRTLLDYGGPNVIPQFSTTNHNTQYAFQLNYTHVFGPHTLNEAIFALEPHRGIHRRDRRFHYTEHNGHRPLRRVRGRLRPGQFHPAQLPVARRADPRPRRARAEVRLRRLVRRRRRAVSGSLVPSGLLVRQPVEARAGRPAHAGRRHVRPGDRSAEALEWNAASRTWGAFVQDTWKARRNLTVTLGFRYDDQGNPWSRNDTTVFGNFYPGAGATTEEQIANGVAGHRTRRSRDRPRRSIPVRAPRGTSRATGRGWSEAGREYTRTGSRRRTSRRSSAATRRAHPPDLLRGIVYAADLRPGHRATRRPSDSNSRRWLARRSVPRRRAWTRRAESGAPRSQSGQSTLS